jgi:hypothetical protein
VQRNLKRTLTRYLVSFLHLTKSQFERYNNPLVVTEIRTGNAASIPSIQQQYLVSTLLVLYKHKIPKRNISFSKGLHASIDKWGYSDDSPMDIDSIMVKEPKDMGPKDIP